MPKQKKTNNKGMTLRKSKAVIIKDTAGAIEEIKGNDNLTFYQIKFLEHLLSLDELPNTIEGLIASADIAKQTFYSWIKELHFMTAFNQVCNCKDVIDRPWIDARNRDKAKTGDLGHQRLYYLRTGALNTGAQTQVGVQVILGTEDKVA